MFKKRNIDRLLNFSDAIVAVAITLLAVPFISILHQSGGINLIDTITSLEFISALSSLLISFFVIYGFWNKHRRVFYEIDEISLKTEELNKFWLLSIILIPAVTNIQFSNESVIGIWMYGMILAFSSLLLRIIENDIYGKGKLFNGFTLLLLLIAMTLAYLVPSLGYSVYYLLFLGIPLRKLSHSDTIE